ncbi:thiamine-phosphate kinase [Isoptericola sp. BMS4]|uniref:thiamine-phosphate kinase n=1 Tax=Isoptericola sp. BMS4 TaxID=2527875 RepID=UPI00141F0E5D|nr:thiamine-phosphate kinase [Isoptericola sp. BMS4]
MTDATDAPGASAPLVRDLSETALLARVFPLLPAGSATLLGPGDDAAVVAAPDGRFVVTTDVLVEDRHFRRRWSTGYDVGARAAVQNLADVAAMGAVPTSLVVSLVVPGDLPVDWVTGLARGLADACAPVGAAVVGGDLSGGDAVVVAVTAHGDLSGRDPVLRSGARPGDVVAHAGVLGRSAAGLALLQGGVGGGAAEGAGPEGAGGPGGAAERCVAGYLRPRAPLAAGPAAADAGATAMLDVSDGLLRDAGRVAAASGVVVDLEAGALAAAAADVAPAARLLGLGDDAALAWVLSGGEDHGLLATFPAGTELPAGFRRLGRVRESAADGPRATVDGAVPSLRPGWDHFER